ncbi:hypothetical protein M0R45_001356 [Rubus argutus]|uniref:Uncharacterized protein n=1 Tax=Rubus argutus TaxID=59490 RepID=A0AAW1VLZ3_RUBAR
MPNQHQTIPKLQLHRTHAQPVHPSNFILNLINPRPQPTISANNHTISNHLHPVPFTPKAIKAQPPQSTQPTDSQHQNSPEARAKTKTQEKGKKRKRKVASVNFSPLHRRLCPLSASIPATPWFPALQYQAVSSSSEAIAAQSVISAAASSTKAPSLLPCLTAVMPSHEQSKPASQMAPLLSPQAARSHLQLSRRSTQFHRPPQSTSRPHRSRQPSHAAAPVLSPPSAEKKKNEGRGQK